MPRTSKRAAAAQAKRPAAAEKPAPSRVVDLKPDGSIRILLPPRKVIPAEQVPFPDRVALVIEFISAQGDSKEQTRVCGS